MLCIYFYRCNNFDIGPVACDSVDNNRLLTLTVWKQCNNAKSMRLIESTAVSQKHVALGKRRVFCAGARFALTLV